MEKLPKWQLATWSHSFAGGLAQGWRSALLEPVVGSASFAHRGLAPAAFLACAESPLILVA